MLRPLAAFLLILPLLGAQEAAPGGGRVFVCAHSFMTFIANLLPPLAKAGGDGFSLVGHQMIGGSQVIQHWNLPNDKAKPALQAGLVDTLILSPTVQMPDPGIDNYVRLGCSVNPRLRILIQASWPAFDDATSTDLAGFLVHSRQFRNEERNAATAASLQAMLDWQRKGWCNRLQQQVAALNRELGREAVRIVPVNEAVFALRQRVLAGSAPGLAKQTDLFKDPIGHPTQALCALVAYCHFAALFGRSPEGLPAPVQLPSPELNPVLQRVAWEAVRPAPAEQAASAGARNNAR